MSIDFQLIPEDDEPIYWSTADKEKAIEFIVGKLKLDVNARIEANQVLLKQNDIAIANQKQHLYELHNLNNNHRRNITNQRKLLTDSMYSLSKELDMIVNHEKIVDVEIEGSTVKVYTKPIYMYDSNDERYYLGNCSFVIDMFNTLITFDNDNRRHGYWSEEDVHPHIDNCGSPCWGTIDTTIVELCSQLQLYSIVLMCLNFLEQANIDDSAGQNVVSWDKVDEEGTIIEFGGTYGLPNQSICSRCDNYVDNDNIYTAYRTVDTTSITDDDGEDTGEVEYGDVHGEHMVCDSCREEYYEYILAVDEWIVM